MTIELARPAIEQARRCALYRHFDASDALLYIGITESLEGRTSGHARGSEWVRFAFRAEAEWHDTRESAAAAEQYAIRHEMPVFNRQHAVGDVDRRIAEYIQQRRIEELSATILAYQASVGTFLDALPASIRAEAEEAATHDYECAGIARDDAFSASVLRHAKYQLKVRLVAAWNAGKAAAYQEGSDFLALRLRETQDSAPIEEPPF